MKRSDRQSFRPNTVLAGLALSLAAVPALAQTRPAAPAAASRVTTVDELEIVAISPNEIDGAVGQIKPDQQLKAEDIAAYGVSSVTDLIDQLAPQLSSNSGRGGGGGPAVLINGRRVSGFNEIRNLPSEAIQRVDILPEEAALTYGFSANQRVVNIVLKSSYSAKLVDLNGGASTAGGGFTGQAETSLTRIAGDKRLNLSFKYNRQDALTEDRRGVIPLATDPTRDLTGQPADQRPFRTLQGESDKTSLNAVYTQPIFAGIGATLNGTLETSKGTSLRGLPDVTLNLPGGLTTSRFVTGFGPLQQQSESWTGHLGAAFNRDFGRWRLALTGAYDHTDNKNANDADLNSQALQAAISAGALIVTPNGPIPATLLALRPDDTGRSKSDGGDLTFTASGPTFTLPAGPARASLRGSLSSNSFSSESFRSGLSQSADFSRTVGSLQANIDLPIASRSRGVLSALGEMGLNANAEVEQVSGFGTLASYGFGLRWTPVRGLNILANQLHDENAPSQQQLGGAIVTTPGVRLFDYVTGQSVDVTQISGGNPALTKDNRNRSSIRVNWQPWQSQQIFLRIDYNRQRYSNTIASFPALTAQVQQAFPERFMRDADGNLAFVDLRPVNFSRQNVSSLRWGLDYSRPIGPQRPPQRAGGMPSQLRGVMPRGPGGAGGQGAAGRPSQPGAQGGQGQAQGQRSGQGQRQAPGQGGPGVMMMDGGGPPPEGGAGGPGGGMGAFGGGQGGGPPGGMMGGGGPGGPGGFGGGGFRGGGGSQNGRLRVSLYQTIFLENEYLLRPGGPLLDFLNGASLGSSGGQPKSEFQAQVNAAIDGIGGELSATYRTGSTVRGGIGGAATDLDFSGIVKVNARLFADLNQRKQLIEKAPFLKNMRLTFSVSNLFDQRVEVTDATGATPYNFQPAFIDPVGRTWRIGIRKLFQ